MEPQFTPEQTPIRGPVVLEALAVWIVLSIIYLLTLAGNHTEAEDGLRYLNDIRDGDPSIIFSPYHLVYGWFAWSAYSVAPIFGYNGGPLVPVQLLDAFTGAFGIALLWVLLRKVAPGRIVAAAGCGILAFSYGYWWYSVEVEVYVLSAMLLIASLFVAYRAAMRPSWKIFALLGGTNGLAVLAHNTNVLFGTVALATLLFAWQALPTRDVVRCALAYAGVSAISIIPPYVVAILIVGLRTPREAYDWLTGYAQNGKWGIWESSNVLEAIVGIGRALVGGHFAFSLGFIQDFTNSYFAGKRLNEEMFLVRDSSTVLAILLLALVAIVAIALSIFLISWLRHPRLSRSVRVLAVLCLSWFIPYALFFTWWEPYNIEFWVAPWVPLAILIALPFSTVGYGAQRRFLPDFTVILVVGMLFVVNLLGSVWPQQKPEDDYWRVRSSWYEHNASASDLIVTTGYISSNYLRYFSEANVLDTEAVFAKHNDVAGAVAELERHIDTAHARRVLISSEVFYPASDKFSHCPDGKLCEDAAAIRDVLLPRTRILAEEPLEEVRVLHPAPAPASGS